MVQVPKKTEVLHARGIIRTGQGSRQIQADSAFRRLGRRKRKGPVHDDADVVGCAPTEPPDARGQVVRAAQDEQVTGAAVQGRLHLGIRAGPAFAGSSLACSSSSSSSSGKTPTSCAMASLAV